MAKYSVILWDFDGVILDSNHVRDKGFIEVLKAFPKKEVDELLAYHHSNGGLSRYVKFRHFFEIIRNEVATDNMIDDFSTRFSNIMKNLLPKKNLLIKSTVDFIKQNYLKYHMHIVSGSDQKELRYLCTALEIEHYFKSIHGSPTAKKDLVKNILETYNYNQQKCILVGDSINDYHAAIENGVNFMAFNNKELDHLSNSKIY